MPRRVPRRGEEGGAAVTEHVEVTGHQLHRPVLLEGCRLAFGKGTIDLGLLDQQGRGWKQVDIADMVGMRVRDGDRGDVRGLQVELVKLGYQLLRARCVAYGRIDWPIGDRVGIAV